MLLFGAGAVGIIVGPMTNGRGVHLTTVGVLENHVLSVVAAAHDNTKS